MPRRPSLGGNVFGGQPNPASSAETASRGCVIVGASPMCQHRDGVNRADVDRTGGDESPGPLHLPLGMRHCYCWRRQYCPSKGKRVEMHLPFGGNMVVGGSITTATPGGYTIVGASLTIQFRDGRWRGERRMDLRSGGNAEDGPRKPQRGGGRPSSASAMPRLADVTS